MVVLFNIVLRKKNIVIVLNNKMRGRTNDCDVKQEEWVRSCYKV